jgi:hypothetical protein
MTSLYFLIITALGTGERSNVSRAVSGYDGSLVPVEDVAARLAPLPEGHDRAALVDDLAACHLYGHPTSAGKTRYIPIVFPQHPSGREPSGWYIPPPET